MPITIGPNIAALASQRRLNESDAAVSRAFERLSSGLRINRASDDAAGLAIATTLQSDSRVFSQGVRNVNDALSMLAITEGALSELSSIATRQQELAEQAANGVLSYRQRLALHNESNALVDEYNRIVASTSFNGIKVLDGSGSTIAVQAGYGTLGSIGVTIGSSAARIAGDGTFAAAINKASGSGTVYDTVAADFNNDGNLDYSIAYSGSVQTFLGNGDASFKAAIVSTVPAGSKYSVGHGDINGDGNEDILVANSTGTTFSVLLGNGSGSFNAAVSYGAGPTSLYRSYLGDFNNDGKLDVVSIGTGGGARVGVALANADGSFNAAVSFLATGISTSDTISVGDFNIDGNLDFIVGDASSPNNAVYFGTGSGTFQSPVVTSVGSGSFGRTAVADLNNDGIDDIIGVDAGTGLVNLRLSNGDGTFKLAKYTGGSQVVLAALADYNGDGINDIALSDNIGAITRVLINNGDSTFRASVSYPTTAGITNAIATGDFNNDGVNDLLLPNFGSAQVSLLLGDTQRTTTIAHIDLTSQSSALEALEAARDARERIANELGQIGASQARLESAARLLGSIVENYTAAASRITDVDVAEEAAKLIAATIRRQAALAIGGQANLIPRIALKLLQDNDSAMAR